MSDWPLGQGDFLYDNNVTGSFTVSGGFEEHPTIAGVRFTVPFWVGGVRLTENRLKSDYQLFKGRSVSILGSNWILSDLEITEDYVYSRYDIALSFQGTLAPIESESVVQINSLDIPADVAPLLDKGFLKLSDLVTYVGGQDWWIPYGIPDDEMRVTSREQLERYARRLHPKGGFLDWNGDRPLVKEWGSTLTHAINPIGEGGQRPKIRWSEPGQGPEVDGVQLTDEIGHAEFVPDTDFANIKRDECRWLPTQEPKNGAHNFLSAENDAIAEGWATNANWFDTGGKVKEAIDEKICNGKPVERRVQRYGFVGGSAPATRLASGPYIRGVSYAVSHTVRKEKVSEIPKDKHGQPSRNAEWIVVPNGSVSPDKWTKLYDVTTHWEYDSDGYEKDVWSQGGLIARYKTEGSGSEAATLLAEIKNLEERISTITTKINKKLGDDDTRRLEQIAEIKLEIAAKKEEMSLYTDFLYIPITRDTDRKTVELGSFGDYYSDYHTTQKNPGKFVLNERRIKHWQRSRIEPGKEHLDPPPKLIVGEFLDEERRVQILIPTSRADKRTGEVYQEQLKIRSAQGDNLKHRFQWGPAEVKDGRPPEHTRMETYGWGNDLPVELASDEETLIIDIPSNNGYAPDDPPARDWSAAGVWRNDQALAAAELEMSIANTQSAKTTKVVIAHAGIVGGDIVQFDGERSVVFDWSYAVEIVQAGLARAETMELGIGRMIAFGDRWQAFYPTPESYPPDLVYPGVNNPPSGGSSTIDYRGKADSGPKIFATFQQLTFDEVSGTIAPVATTPEFGVLSFSGFKVSADEIPTFAVLEIAPVDYSLIEAVSTAPTFTEIEFAALDTSAIAPVEATPAFQELSITALSVSRIRSVQAWPAFAPLTIVDIEVSAIAPVTTTPEFSLLTIREVEFSMIEAVAEVPVFNNLEFMAALFSLVQPVTQVPIFTQLSFESIQLSLVLPVSDIPSFAVLDFEVANLSLIEPVSEIPVFSQLTFEPASFSRIEPVTTVPNFSSLTFEEP
ncbi:MAG: hypothetical protein F6J87_14850 [Spirulina sp. SIO3F2]|nr:hypothetical protein [Spirulina sp. SIO3F2]